MGGSFLEAPAAIGGQEDGRSEEQQSACCSRWMNEWSKKCVFRGGRRTQEAMCDDAAMSVYASTELVRVCFVDRQANDEMSDLLHPLMLDLVNITPLPPPCAGHKRVPDLTLPRSRRFVAVQDEGHRGSMAGAHRALNEEARG
eukprot:160257-Hanusia_phi.AAC.1